MVGSRLGVALLRLNEPAGARPHQLGYLLWQLVLG